MHAKSSRQPVRVAREILAYFLRNPAAADSLEGLARWRLLEQVIHRNVVDTKKAVEWLVKRELLIESSDLSQGRLFRLNPGRRDEAELLIHKSAHPKSDEECRP